MKCAEIFEGLGVLFSQGLVVKRLTVSGYMIITITEVALGVVVKGLKQNPKPGAATFRKSQTCNIWKNGKMRRKNTFTNLS